VQCGALAVVLAALPYKAFDLDRFFAPKELVLFAAATAGALLTLKRTRRLSPGLLDAALAAFLLLGLLSAAAATNHWLAARSLGVSFCGILIFWVARSLARAGHGRELLAALAIATVTAAVTALLQAYGAESEYVSLNRAPGGTLGNRNFIAHLAAVGLPTVALCGLQGRSAAATLLAAVGAALASAALVLSRSRAAWLALATCGAIFLVVRLVGSERWRALHPGPRLTALVIAAAAGAVAALTLPNTLNWRSESPYLESVLGMVNYKEGSGRGRVVQYETTLRMAAAHPLLGVGPGNWSVIYPRFAEPNDPSLTDEGMTANPWPSSDWVAFLAERGAPAFALLVLVLAGLAIGALRRALTSRHTEELLPAAALALTLVSLGIVGAFDAVLLLPAPAFLVWATLGALAPDPAANPTARPIPATRPSPARRLFIYIVSGAGGLLVLYGALRVAAMAVYSSSGTVAAIERASRLDPGSFRLQLRLADLFARRGRCDLVRRHAGAAKRLYPAAPAPRRLLADCGSRERRI
jgi:O-antigen ligase